MLLWTTNYNLPVPKTYCVKINHGQISENTIKVYDELDQEINNIKSVVIDFNLISEACVVNVTYHNDEKHILTVIGIDK